MMFYTHLVLGFFVGLVGVQFLNPHNQIPFMLFCLFGAILPDIDHPKSKIGRHLKPITYLFTHRGFFHSLFAIVLFAMLIESLFGRMLTYAIVLGYASHLLSDAATKEGIMPFHPVSSNRIRGFLVTGKTLEHIILIVLTVVTVWLLLGT